MHPALHRVVLAIWPTEQAPQDSQQDILLPIPKKGDASLCSNHRTIALQSIASKAYNILSARLSDWLADHCSISNVGSDQTEALLTLCSVYAYYVTRHGTRARLCTSAC